jgi:protein tyrosine phosphatase (PTP) superfamily phosphohydrolase (DUF442 family)
MPQAIRLLRDKYLTKNIFAIALSVGIAALFSLIAPLAVSAHEDAELEPVSETILLSARVHNFDKVTDHVWRGAVPSDKSLEKIASSGINTIVDLRMDGDGSEHEAKTAQSLGMHYLHIPMGFNQPSDEQIHTFLKTVLDPNSGAVFVHCRQGADRTGTLCAIYRRLVDGISYDEAYHEMRKHHFKPFLAAMKKTVQDFPYEQYRHSLSEKSSDKSANRPDTENKISFNG